MASKKAPPFLKKGAKKAAPKMPKPGMKKSGKSGSKC